MFRLSLPSIASGIPPHPAARDETSRWSRLSSDRCRDSVITSASVASVHQ